VSAEVFFEERIDGGFQHESIVDGDHADLRLTVPARGAATSDAAVHDIVGDKEEGL